MFVSRARYNEQVQRVRDRDEEIEKLTESLQACESRERELRRRCDQTKNALDSRRESQQLLEISLKEARVSAENLGDRVNELTAKAIQDGQQIENLRFELNNEKTRSQQFLAQTMDLQGIVNAESEKDEVIEGLRSEVDRLMGENEELFGKLDAAKSDNISLKQERDEAWKKLEDLTGLVSKAHDSRALMEDDFKRADEELVQLRDKVDRVRAVVTAWVKE